MSSGRGVRSKVAVIGLDCAEPSLIFDRWKDELPNLARLRRRGVYGELESVVPAITAPAWACMTTGKDPGTLGVYGFRNRTDGTYDGLEISNGRAIREPRIWDVLARSGGDRRAVVLGVPQTYPPKPMNGCLVTSFLTPGTDHPYTYPLELADRIREWVGDYMLDVDGFRTDDKDWLLDRIREMTRKRFEVARRLLDGEPWDLFMMVEMGTDRIHHGLWKDMDPEHRDHDPDSPYRDAILDYYREVDAEIGTLLDRFGDDTHVLVVSDHGARRMEGGVAINEWLAREGYLTLASRPDPGARARLSEVDVDWDRTRAWAAGGYYGRIFLNLQGREPRGTVDPREYEALRSELAGKLEALEDHEGRPMGNRCFRPEEIYREVRGFPPDLLVYFGDLAWRSIGSVGWDAIHVFENDTGPDEANHAQNGIFLYADPSRDLGGRRLEGLHLLEVAPTVLELLGEKVPFDMQRSPIPEVVGRAAAAPG